MTTPINEILEFGEDSTNVLAQVDYSADAGRLAGRVPGLARSALNNTALRQVTRFCRGLAQFIAEHYEPGVVDDGDVAKIVAGMEAAIEALVLAFAPSPGQATTAAQGIVELATNAEAVTGTDTLRAVTPAGLTAAIAAHTTTITLEQFLMYS